MRAAAKSMLAISPRPDVKIAQRSRNTSSGCVTAGPEGRFDALTDGTRR
jgi:hypothetical protein